MRVPQITDYIVNMYFIGRIKYSGTISIMFFGPPGIGKSEAIYEAAAKIAKKLGREFVVYSAEIADMVLRNPDRYFVLVEMRLYEGNPEDFIGVPRDMDGYIEYKPFRWVMVLRKVPGILFLDEVTNVTRLDLKAVSYKLLLDKAAGFVRFNDGVMVVAAGNSSKHSSIAEGFTAPQANRMLIIHLDPPTVDEWAEYMNRTYGDEWDKTTYAFLKSFEKYGYILKVPKEPLVEEQFPSPRSWTYLAVARYRSLKMGLGDVDPTHYVGTKVGNEFRGFARIEIDIEELISRPEKWRELDIEAKYMACLMFANTVERMVRRNSDISRTFKLVDEMCNDSREYIVLICKLMKESVARVFVRKLIEYNASYAKIIKDVIDIKYEVVKV